LFIQRTAQGLLECIEAGDLSEAAQERFNAKVNEHFEGTRDYIVTHYKTNSRTDTEYWRANNANPHISDGLKELYAIWMAGKSIAADVGRQRIGKGYPIFSWYCILAGMGIFPPPGALRRPNGSAHYDVEEIQNMLERSAENFPRQSDVLARIPAKPREKSLQIYFW